MKIKFKSSSIMLILLIILALVVIFTSFSMTSTKVKMLPLVIAALIIFLSLIELIRETVIANRTKDTPSKIIIPIQNQKLVVIKYFFEFLWLIGFFLAIYLVGFIIAIPIFVFSYLKTHGLSWLRSFVVTAISAAAIYVGFIILLKAKLFEGIIFGGQF